MTDFDVGPRRVKSAAARHDVSIAAGVDATLLKDGPAEAIVDRIKGYIDKMARDGRCMIHFNQNAAGTPPEHVHAAVAACHTYGRLPIPENLDDVHFEISHREIFSEFVSTKGVTGKMLENECNRLGSVKSPPTYRVLQFDTGSQHLQELGQPMWMGRPGR